MLDAGTPPGVLQSQEVGEFVELSTKETANGGHPVNGVTMAFATGACANPLYMKASSNTGNRSSFLINGY